MNNPINWPDLTIAERNGLIHTKVMGNPEFCPGQLTTEKENNPSRIPGQIAWSYWLSTCSACEFQWTTTDTRKAPIPERHVPKGAIPNYCEDMNAAWLIVEKLHEQYDVCIRVIQGEVQQKYFVQLYDRDSHETQDGMQSDVSIQEAIMLAVLEIKGVNA